MKFIVLLALFFAVGASAESCVSLSGLDYINNDSTLEQCSEYIVMTYQNYNSMQSEVFNESAYDYGFEGVIRMFVAGVCIGLVLAMVGKLRR